MRTPGLIGVFIAVATAAVYTQAPTSSAAQGPTFDVVSIKKNTSTTPFANGSNERPDGGFTLLNIPIGTLIGRAYPPAVPVDMVGLPGWATSERYDVLATSPLARAATPDERTAMLRAMLADRFKLVAHMESREQPVYNLIVASNDGRLGPNMKPSDVDCAAQAAADRAATEAARAAGTVPPRLAMSALNGPPPSCSIRITGPRMDGGTTMEMLARLLRPAAGRYVVDKTGLTGTYSITLTYDRMAGRGGPDATPAADAPPSVFTAVQEQLGLKLESSRAPRETLVIDRLERPTEN